MSLIIPTPHTTIITASPTASTDTAWLNYFDPQSAIRDVYAHIATLPSSATDERHTLRVYDAGLKYFIDWQGDSLPTESAITEFIAHLRVGKHLKPSTIGSKYLAPVRLYLNKLAGQHIPRLNGDARNYVEDCRLHIRRAAEVKTPRSTETSNIAPLWRNGKRLELNQINAVLRSINTNTPAGSRDYALLYIGFTTGLRLAEIARITPDSLINDGDNYLITVRGKRNNSDPVPLDAAGAAALNRWQHQFNAMLEPNDMRRITPDKSYWQPLRPNGTPVQTGENGYTPITGISSQSIRQIIARRTEEAIGFSIAPHDMRRTAAALMYRQGAPINAIQKLLRHKDPAVTLHYIGEEPDYDKIRLTAYVQIG